VERSGTGVVAGVGDQVVAADRQTEGQEAAGLDLLSGSRGAQRADRLAEQGHAAVVHAPQAAGDGLVAAGQVSDRQVDRQQAVAGEGQDAGARDPGSC
jgi:hypothetical protein